MGHPALWFPTFGAMMLRQMWGTRYPGPGQ
jgi:hypothetical protein